MMSTPVGPTTPPVFLPSQPGDIENQPQPALTLATPGVRAAQLATYAAAQAASKWFFLRAAGPGALAFGVTEGFWEQLRHRVRQEGGASALTCDVATMLEGRGDLMTAIAPLRRTAFAATLGYGLPYVYKSIQMPWVIPFHLGLTYMMTAPQLAAMWVSLDEKGNPHTPAWLNPGYGAAVAGGAFAANAADWMLGRPIGRRMTQSATPSGPQGSVPGAVPQATNTVAVPAVPGVGTWMENRISAEFSKDLGGGLADIIWKGGTSLAPCEGKTPVEDISPLYDPDIPEQDRLNSSTTQVLDAAYFAAKVGSCALVGVLSPHNPVFYLGAILGAWMELNAIGPEMLAELPPAQQAMVMQLMGSKVSPDLDVFHKLSTERKVVDLGISAAETGTRVFVNGLGVAGQALVGGAAGYELGRLAVHVGRRCVWPVWDRVTSWLSPEAKETLNTVAALAGGVGVLAATTYVTGWWGSFGT